MLSVSLILILVSLILILVSFILILVSLILILIYLILILNDSDIRLFNSGIEFSNSDIGFSNSDIDIYTFFLLISVFWSWYQYLYVSWRFLQFLDCYSKLLLFKISVINFSNYYIPNDISFSESFFTLLLSPHDF